MEDLSSTLRLRPRDGSANELGIDFERKMAALLFLRLHRLNYKFFMYKNVEASTPLDDIVIFLQLKDKSYLLLVQLKHGMKHGSSVPIKQFLPPKAQERGARNDSFNLRKYFDWYAHFYEIYEDKRIPGTDEAVLKKIPIDNVWCMIYTNKVITGLSSSYSGKDTKTGATLRVPYDIQNIQDLKMLELFITNSRGEIIQFNESENLVWNFMKNEPGEELYQKKFLPRLVVFSGQEHVNGLDKIIMEEIKFVLGKTLPPDTERSILLNYYEEIKRWWKETNGENVCEESRLLEKAVAEELRRLAKEATDNDILRFRHSACEELSLILEERPKYLLVTVSEMPMKLRAAKILQVLDENVAAGKRYSWSYVNDRTLEIFPPNELWKVCCTCDIIILDIDDKSNHKFIEYAIPRRCDNNTMIIFNFYNGSMYEHCDLDGVKLIDENWTMKQLCEDTQKSLMQRIVQFQGEDVVLADLVKNYPALRSYLEGKALANLASRQTFAIGKPLSEQACNPPAYYVPRVVQHRTVLNETIFDVRSNEDCFVLRGFPNNILRLLRRSDSPWKECKSSWAPIYDQNDLCKISFQKLLFIKENIGSNIQTKWVNWHKNMDVERYGQNIHWLTYYENSILWDESEGDSNIIDKHIKKMSDLCKTAAICQHNSEDDLVSWLEHRIVLADVTGMGKSTFLINMARKIKKRYKASWVIFMRANDVAKSLPENVEKKHIFDILCQKATNNSPCLSSPTELAFFKECLVSKSEGYGNVIIFVDGIDEVCPALKSKVFQMLELLQEILEKISGRLWAAARSVLREDLARTLHCPAPISLFPFSREDQCRFFHSCWSVELEKVERPDISRQINAFVDAVREATGSHSESLCDVPLYTKLLSDIYKGHELTYLLRDREGTVASRINRLYLYKKFVEKTLNIKFEKREIAENDKENLDINKVTKQKYEEHQELAMEKCFCGRENILQIVRQYFKHINRNKRNDSYHIEISSQDGLVSFNSGIVEFIHFSVAEYLAATWLFDHVKDIHKKTRQVTKALYTDQMGDCRFFFDALLADGSEIHMAALTSQRNSLRRFINNVKKLDSVGRNALHFAAIAGNVSAITDLLAAGGDPHVKDNLLNWTPLRYANEVLKRCHKNGVLEKISHMDVIEKMITKKCKSHDISNLLKNKDLVIYAVEKGYVNIVRMVLNKTKTIINQILKNNAVHNYELVYFAAKNERKDILQLLKTRGVKVNRIEKGKDLSLHDAVQHGFVEMCDLLLKMGADTNERNKDEDTPLHYAARSGNEDICKKLLCHGADIRVRNKRNQSVLYYAVREAHNNIKRTLTKSTGLEPHPEIVEDKHIKLIKFLLDKGIDVREKCDGSSTALHIASFLGCRSLVSFLIEKGLDVNAVDQDYIPSLHWAVLGGHEDICLWLIEKGANINHKDSDGYTPLHCAAVGDRLPICDLLLRKGANINAQCKEKSTCLHRAAQFSHVSFCEFLLRNRWSKPDPNLQDKDLKTPLHLAAFNGSTEICQMLIDNGADVSKTDINGWEPIHHSSSQGHEAICRLILNNNNGNIRARLPGGSTALHLAAMKGHDDVCRLLIGHGADINAIQHERNTPLHLAVLAKQMGPCKALLEHRANFRLTNINGYTAFHILADTGEVGMLKLLVLYAIQSKSTNPERTEDEIIRDCLSLQTTEGSTPLHLASRRGHLNVCKYLIQCGVNVDTRDRFQKRALHYAVQNGHNLLSKYLVEIGAVEDRV